MLRDRYDPLDLFTQIPGCCLRLEPVLAHLDPLLDDDALFTAVKQDLARRRPHTLTRGRPSTPVEVILRLLVVKRLYNWSYEQVEYFVSDSLGLRQFCRVYWQAVPDDTTLLRWAQLIGPETLQRLHARVVALAQEQQLTRGRKLRLDTTVLRTNIHAPTDSALLTDGVRGISRLAKRAQGLLVAVGQAAAAGREAFRDRTRSMRKRSAQLRRLSRSKQTKEEKRAQLQTVYAGLIALAQQSRAQGARVLAALQGAGTALAQAGQRLGQQARKLQQRLESFLPLVDQVIDQARRRVLYGEVVPAADKLLSLFETHTQLITRGKASAPVEFGRKVLLEEVEGGLISGYALLPTANQDGAHLPESLERHQKQFGRAPHLLTGDRGFASAANFKAAREAGVKQVAIPHLGRAGPEVRAREKQRWYREGYGWRAGIEGRISLLQRRFGLDRCRYRGETGLERWLGWGILAHNLWQMGRAQAARQAS